jgi:hypothetical protein
LVKGCGPRVKPWIQFTAQNAKSPALRRGFKLEIALAYCGALVYSVLTIPVSKLESIVGKGWGR